MRIGGVVGSSVLVVSLALGGTAFADGHRGSLKDGVVVTKNFKWDGLSIGIGGGYGWADVDASSELTKKHWGRDCVTRDYKRDKKAGYPHPFDQEKYESWANKDSRDYENAEWGYTVNGPIGDDGKNIGKVWTYKDGKKRFYEALHKCHKDYWLAKSGYKTHKPHDGLWVYDYENERMIGDPHIYKKQQSLELDGGIFTAQIGLDRRLGNRFVGGIFADFDKWLGDGDKVYTLAPPSGRHHHPKKVYGDLELDYTATVGARLGILVHNDSTLIYGLVGYTWAQFEDIHWQSVYKRRCRSSCGPGLGSTSLDASGLTLGAGIERKFNDRVSLKAEYRYTDLDEEGIGWDSDIKWNYHGKGLHGKSYHYKQDYDTDMHSVRVLLSFKLGHDRHTPLK